VPQRVPLGLVDAAPLAWRHLARVNPLREIGGESLARNISNKDVARQNGNGVIDSLPLESGNLDVQLGRQRLTLAHPLCTVVLSKQAIEGSFQSTRVPEQTTQSRRVGYALLEEFHLPSFGFDQFPFLLILFEAANLGPGNSGSNAR